MWVFVMAKVHTFEAKYHGGNKRTYTHPPEETNDKFKNLGFIKTLSPDRAPVSAQLFVLCLQFHLLERKLKQKKRERNLLNQR